MGRMGINNFFKANKDSWRSFEENIDKALILNIEIKIPRHAPKTKAISFEKKGFKSNLNNTLSSVIFRLCWMSSK